MTIEATSKKNFIANNVLITSKAVTWEPLVNYFEKHYIENGLGLNRSTIITGCRPFEAGPYNLF